MRFGILKLTLSFLLCFMINLSAQTKEELKTVKKVLKQEKKMEKRKARIEKKIAELENPNWLKFDLFDPSKGIIEYDPRKKYRLSVLGMVSVLCYWAPKVKKLQITIIDPCDEGNFLNNILLVIPPEDINAIRSFRVEDLETRYELADTESGSIIPPILRNELSSYITQNCGLFSNIEIPR